jgi:two-component system chemotaxis response regulator CheY
MSRVLVVEDHAPMRAIMAAVLQSMGHQVFQAGNGREALEVQKEARAELMLTDLFMPEMEGLETIRRMRALYPELRIMAVSGGSSRGDAGDYLEMAQKFGAKATLRKPFTIKEMTDAVTAVGFGAPPAETPV